MSQLVYPSLQGVSIEVSKTPSWQTIIQKTASRKETRIQYESYPLYQISLKYSFLTNANFYMTQFDASDYETIVAFYNTVGGSFDDFLFLDATENTSTNQLIGVSDSTTTDFQLVRSVSTWIEPIFGYSSATIYVDGVEQIEDEDYTINDYGLVSFASAPTTGNITWSGQYYFRCRFLQDSMGFDYFLYCLYKLDKVELTSVKI